MGIDLIVPVIQYTQELDLTLASCADYKDQIHIVIKSKCSDRKLIECIDYYRDSGLHITLQVEDDDGIYSAINQGLRKVIGTHVLVLGVGDLLTTHFGKVIEFLRNDTVVVSPVLLCGKDGSKKLYSGRLTPSHQGIVYPTHIFKNLEYREEFRIISDRILYDHVSKMVGLKFHAVGFPISEFQLTGISSDKAGRLIILKESLMHLKEEPRFRNVLRFVSSLLSYLRMQGRK